MKTIRECVHILRSIAGNLKTPVVHLKTHGERPPLFAEFLHPKVFHRCVSSENANNRSLASLLLDLIPLELLGNRQRCGFNLKPVPTQSITPNCDKGDAWDGWDNLLG